MDITLWILKSSASLIALLVAIIGHEIMHGVAALYFGDSTARDEGRLSINPLRHIDPLGSLVFPALLLIAQSPFLFGWAKPVPVNMSRVLQRGGYLGAIIVSLAGIMFNLLCAIIVANFIDLTVQPQSLSDAFITLFLYNLVLYSVVLAIFNLWPIPPMDGANALGYIALSIGNQKIPAWFNSIERYGMIIIIIILATPLSQYFFAPVEWILHWLIK